MEELDVLLPSDVYVVEVPDLLLPSDGQTEDLEVLLPQVVIVWRSLMPPHNAVVM